LPQNAPEREGEARRGRTEEDLGRDGDRQLERSLALDLVVLLRVLCTRKKGRRRVSEERRGAKASEMGTHGEEAEDHLRRDALGVLGLRASRA